MPFRRLLGEKINLVLARVSQKPFVGGNRSGGEAVNVHVEASAYNRISQLGSRDDGSEILPPNFATAAIPRPVRFRTERKIVGIRPSTIFDC
jgi:hypothetical protein